MSIRTTILDVLLAMSFSCSFVWADTPKDYPDTRRIDHVDTYHGQQVPDPYRWLEEDVRDSEAVADWVERQNEVTFGYLKQIPTRDRIIGRLTELWDYEKYGTPFKKGDRYFYSKNDGLQNQSVLYTMKSLDDEPQVLIDPNLWSEEGTVALSGMAVSDDATYLAYGVADAGSDWNTWHVMEIDTGKVLQDELRWVKFSGASWNKEGSGFYYSRFDEPKEGDAFQSLNLNQKVYFHEVGTPQSADQLIYKRSDHPEWGFGAEVSEDDHYLVITVWKGTDDKYLVFYKDLRSPDSEFVELIKEFENEYSFVGNDNGVFYFKTDFKAPRGRLIAIDTTNPSRDAWREIVPQSSETLTGVGLINNWFVTDYLKDARSQIKLFDLDGKFIRDVELPGIGTVGGFGGEREETETFYSFTSFTTPSQIFHYDMVTGESTKIREAKVDFDPNDFEVKQIFYTSKDGTKVPMFIAHKTGISLDGSNPTLLYGYGGFNISLTPSFSISRLGWMEMGGVFAMPNLRGGGEYGEDWHVAGKLQDKQNVFDDFIAAAEWLIENKVTSPKKLAIQGRSNGGLLVGACMTQRPDLFGACLPGVGVMDMLRFHKFTAGRYWVDEYGSSDDAKLFPVLLEYSPYHNLQQGTSYPATMITTADTDDRVVPGHSFKFAAALQNAHDGPSPVLIRIETKAGHGAGKPTSKQIEEVADEWAFLADNLGLEPSGD
jgi:prolyl oligopeptidase